MSNNTYIIAAHRSAVIPKGGAFARLAIHQLAAPVIKAVLDNAKISPNCVDELILSNAVGGGGNPARLAALTAGLEDTVGGLSIDRQCTGGLDAIWLAAQMIKSGAHEIIVAGGAESASLRPIRLAIDPNGGAPVAYDRPDFTGLPNRDPDMVDSMVSITQDYGISRAAQEDWAIQSHAKALAAEFGNEIVAIEEQTNDRFTRALTPNVCERAPVLAGTITAATTAVDADAAAFCLVVSERIAKSVPNAIRIVEGVSTAGKPDAPALAPICAMEHILKSQNIHPQNLRVVEIMEAYAAQAIIAAQAQSFDSKAINIGGGALARGHPIGASGAILAVRLYHELQRSGGAGLATIAAAGGLASAILLERGRF